MDWLNLFYSNKSLEFFQHQIDENKNVGVEFGVP